MYGHNIDALELCTAEECGNRYVVHSPQTRQGPGNVIDCNLAHPVSFNETWNTVFTDNDSTVLDGPMPTSFEAVLTTNSERPFNLGGVEWALWERILVVIVGSFVITFTISSNAFVIYAVTHHNPLKIIPNYFLVSLSCADILMASVVMPVALQYNLEGVWHYGLFLCKAWSFSSYFSSASSIFHLCAIAIDRYRAITRPLEYGTKRTTKQALSVIALVWFLSFAVVCPPYFGILASWPDTFEITSPCTAAQNPIYVVCSGLITFYIPMIIMITIYTRLFLIGRKRFRKKIRRALELVEINDQTKSLPTRNSPALYPVDLPKSDSCVEVIAKAPPHSSSMKRSMSNGDDPAKEVGKGRSRGQIIPTFLLRRELLNKKLEEKIPCSRCSGMIPKSRGKYCQLCSAPNNLVLAAEKSRLTILLQRERRSVLIMSIILCTFIVCWLPAFTLYVVLGIKPQLGINPKLMTICWWMAYCNSACNPIIYTIFNKDFNGAFHKLFKK
eukprot:maker-scaffold268_size230776-snap-gene-0.4 protein:Tk11092 transcript:maker-scaffold268_size230776-snap-gene-0.4-mRNA-1 annotation:"tyramine receptor"